VVVPRRRQFSRLVVVVGVVGVRLVGALRALVGVVGAVVAVGCRRAPGVVVGGQELVLVGARPSKHIWGLSFSFSEFTSFFNYYDFHSFCFLLLHGVVPMWWGGPGSLFSLIHKSYN